MTESERMENGTLCKWNKKKAGVAIPISDKIDFKTKAETRDKEEHYVMKKVSIQQGDITIVTIYTQHRST